MYTEGKGATRHLSHALLFCVFAKYSFGAQRSRSRYTWTLLQAHERFASAVLNGSSTAPRNHSGCICAPHCVSQLCGSLEYCSIVTCTDTYRTRTICPVSWERGTPASFEEARPTLSLGVLARKRASRAKLQQISTNNYVVLLKSVVGWTGADFLFYFPRAGGESFWWSVYTTSRTDEIGGFLFYITNHHEKDHNDRQFSLVWQQKNPAQTSECVAVVAQERKFVVRRAGRGSMLLQLLK